MRLPAAGGKLKRGGCSSVEQSNESNTKYHVRDCFVMPIAHLPCIPRNDALIVRAYNLNFPKTKSTRICRVLFVVCLIYFYFFTISLAWCTSPSFCTVTKYIPFWTFCSLQVSTAKELSI